MSYVDLLQTVAEDLRRTDRVTYNATEEAIGQGSRPVLQVELGEEKTISLGLRDDYGNTRWVHSAALE